MGFPLRLFARAIAPHLWQRGLLHVGLLLAVCGAFLLPAQQAPLPRADGYWGIWYFNQPSKDEYVYKYSGGFATYPQQHAPIAIYSREANKTFFVYGGATEENPTRLLHMVSYFDHKTGMVPRPVILMDKQTEDAHDNPTLSIDGEGYLWIFSAAHGTARPAYLSRSCEPYRIDCFERVLETNFSYPQPWYLAGKGFLFLHTRYQSHGLGTGAGRALYWMTSADGRAWSEPRLLAFAQQGHYQISTPYGRNVGTAFNVHPPPLGLNQRTNLYYLESADMGESWRSADGRAVTPPVREEASLALVRDYRKENLLVYLKDLQYDAKGHPVILYLTSSGYESGPKGGERVFRIAHWTGGEWRFRDVCKTDHNYDFGSLYLEEDGNWRFIAPTAPGPQAWATGGDMEMWISGDEGATWRKEARLTNAARRGRERGRNHNYARRPWNAHPEFYAIWADGDAFKPSPSNLYFANQEGDVFRLPARMSGDFAAPVPIPAN